MHEISSKYDILKLIGHGGFSAVFKARCKDNYEKIVALKQLDYTVTDTNAKEYRDFKEEVEILKKLNHKNIVHIFGEYILDNKPVLEMEFIDGDTLESVIRQEKYLSIEEVLDVIAQIASALDYCHHYHIPDTIFEESNSVLLKKNSIIHNDINPKNIIRAKNEDGAFRYVLVDFGLSFIDPDTVRHSKKEEGMSEYKSPEKWDAANVDTPSDIYGFGIVLYELLTGSVPFPVKNYNEETDKILREKHKSEDVPDLCKKRLAAILEKEYVTPETCDIPDWLQMLIKKCLEKEPSQRFKTGKELLEFFHDGLSGKIEKNEDENLVIDIDPDAGEKNIRKESYLEALPNILTEAQHFFLKKDYTTIGRYNDISENFSADFSLRTADKFISKNHCQITKKSDENNHPIYYLTDVQPSKNGTFYNTEKNSTRLQPHEKIPLNDGDYFWIGNTKIVFHE
jgi:serine/threonine protein kinase